MQYIYSDQPTKSAASDVATSIIEHLNASEKVLLLLSGGSGIDVALKFQMLLNGINSSNLYVTLTDERFVDIDDANENWRQLLNAGLLLPDANLYRPLIGKSIIETTDRFNSWLNSQLETADYKIGIFGIGSDHHTAGIKPNSQPANLQSSAYSYAGNDFERITISTITIQKLDKIVVQASGADKQAAVNKLFSADYPVNNYPDQILKSVGLSNFYTDQKIEEAK